MFRKKVPAAQCQTRLIPTPLFLPQSICVSTCKTPDQRGLPWSTWPAIPIVRNLPITPSLCCFLIGRFAEPDAYTDSQFLAFYWRGQGESNLLPVLQTGPTGLKPAGRPAPLPPVPGSKGIYYGRLKKRENDDYAIMKRWDLIFRSDLVPTEHG